MDNKKRNQNNKSKIKESSPRSPNQSMSKSPKNNKLIKLYVNNKRSLDEDPSSPSKILNTSTNSKGSNKDKNKLENSSKSLTRQNKFKVDKSQKESNPIPSKPKDRLNFIRLLFNNDALQRHLNSSPPRTSSTFEDTAKYLASYSKNDLEIFALLFLWITSNISYDTTSFFSGILGDQSPETTFKTGTGVCGGYAELFTAMSKAVGLKAETTPGYAKGYGYKENQNFIRTNHAWNVISIYKTWYFVDTTWSSGSINDEKKFEKKFTFFYFLSMPEFIIGTHRPVQDKWQLSTRPISQKQFEAKKSFNYSQFYTAVYEKHIELITHSVPVIFYNESQLKIKLEIKNIIPSAKLLLNNVEMNADSAKSNFESSTNILTIDVTFDKNGEYVLWVLSKINKDGKDVLQGILFYTVIVNILINTKKSAVRSPNKIQILSPRGKSVGGLGLSRKNKKSSKDILNNSTENINPDSLITALKPKCFDNANAYLYEPKNLLNIKIGQAINVKVKVKGATSVAVLDYKQFTYLRKKADDIWEGNVNIKTVFVTIVSQKSSSLFTEVYEFTNIK